MGVESSSFDPTREKQEQNVMGEFREQKMRERKEGRKDAIMDVSIDKAALKELIAASPDPVQRETFERFSRLPDTLEFRPGITLIVGENGAGKSTLAKALLLAMRVRERTDSMRLDAAYDEDEEAFRTAPERASKEIFNPTMSMWEMQWLQQAGLAPALARTIHSGDAYSTGRVDYTDLPEIIGELKSKEVRLAQDDKAHDIEVRHMQQVAMDRANREGQEYRGGPLVKVRSGEEYVKESAIGPKLSHRQTLDKVIPERMYGDPGKKPGPYIHFIDEPETGLSPWRHRELAKWIETVSDIDRKDPHSIVVTPTNSVVLYESDEPRIDLRFPELGIHRPSEHQETYQNQ